MKLYFGESVRRLRLAAGLTQEQLAQRLHVSFQTISKWERNESYPDITMLPALAGIFGVKVDELLGVDQAENERRIQELIMRYESPGPHKFDSMKEYIAPLKAMVKEFPQEWRLWGLYFGLMTSLSPSDDAQRVRERLPEVRQIYDNILENCTNDAIRIGIKGTMCHFLIRIVQRDPENCEAERAEIKRIIGELPDLLDSREYTSTMFLPGTLEECKTACQEAIISTLKMLEGMISHLGNNLADRREEWNMTVLPLKQIGLAIYNAVIPDGAYGPLFGSVYGTMQHMIHGYAQKGDFDAAFAAIEQLVEISRRYDALPHRSELTSPLFEGYVFEKTGFNDFQALEGTRGFLEGAERTWTFFHPWPQAFRDDPRFAEILAQLSE